jgi:hypothetical protein
VGAGLLYISINSLSLNTSLPDLSIVYLELLVTGAVLLLFVPLWSLQLSVLWCAESRPVRLSALALLLLGLTGLLAGTALLWQAAARLEATGHTVRGPCYCGPHTGSQGPPVLDRLGLCVERGAGCSATLLPVRVNITGMLLLTAACQPVDLGPRPDPACLQYQAFRGHFLLLRVLLPLLLLALLPGLVTLHWRLQVPGLSTLCTPVQAGPTKEGKEFTSDSISWSGLELPPTPAPSAGDPVLHYSMMCRPLGERLPPGGSQCSSWHRGSYRAVTLRPLHRPSALAEGTGPSPSPDSGRVMGAGPRDPGSTFRPSA